MLHRWAWLAGVCLAVTVSACGVAGRGGDSSGQTPSQEVGHGDPGESVGEEMAEEESPEPLTRRQMKGYYAAQVEWRTCAVDEGLTLPEPPTLDVFVARGGLWWVGRDISEDDWNQEVVEDESGGGSVGAACGEPPIPSDFTAD